MANNLYYRFNFHYHKMLFVITVLVLAVTAYELPLDGHFFYAELFTYFVDDEPYASVHIG